MDIAHPAVVLLLLAGAGGLALWAYLAKDAEAMVRHAWTAFALIFVIPAVLYHLAWWIIGRRPF